MTCNGIFSNRYTWDDDLNLDSILVLFYPNVCTYQAFLTIPVIFASFPNRVELGIDGYFLCKSRLMIGSGSNTKKAPSFRLNISETKVDPLR